MLMLDPRRGRTTIYVREDGVLVHFNVIGSYVGREYEHDDPNWQPSDDWPYEIVDYRKKEKEHADS